MIAPSQNDNKMTMNTKMLKIPLTCMLQLPSSPNIPTIPESQISLRFVLRPAISELQAILRQVHQMTQNDLEH